MKNQNMWIFMLVLGTILLILALAPLSEIYWGWNMPFVNINHSEFEIYGFNIPPESQLGVVLLMGLSLMLPGRLIPLAIMKLTQKR